MNDMANMKYCMFENTYNDLRDCYDAISESSIEDLEDGANQYEKKYIRKLLQLCQQITQDFSDELESEQ